MEPVDHGGMMGSPPAQDAYPAPLGAMAGWSVYYSEAVLWQVARGRAGATSLMLLLSLSSLLLSD